MKSDKNWIKGAIKKPGAFTAQTGGTVPSWKGGPVKPGGIGVPPKKLT